MFDPPWLLRLPYGFKVIALAVLPLLLATALVAVAFQRQSHELAQAEVSALEELMLKEKRVELENQVALITSALEFLVRTEPDASAARTKGEQLLTSTRYSVDGYFFVYDTTGTCVVHPKIPELVGKTLPELTRSFGSTIPEIVRIGGQGGGFLNYTWQKPSLGEDVDKLGYVRLFAPWGWIIGTGVYIDDIERATSALRERSRASVNRMLWAMGGVATTAVLLVFAGLLILNLNEKRLADRQLQDLARRVVERGDEERGRVARLLHDELSQLLVAARYHFESLENHGDSAQTGSRSLRLGLEGLSRAIRTTRELSHDLCPPELADFGLSSALASYVEEYRDRAGLDVMFEDASPDCKLSDEQSVHLFCIAREALTNVERHAKARYARVALTTREDKLQLTITDDGVGFDVLADRGARPKGIGLRNMRERIEHLGGRLTVHSQRGQTAITASLPLGDGTHA